jgi:hypothetical protein
MLDHSDASWWAASSVKALAEHACGRSALAAAGAEAVLAAAAASRGAWATSLTEALEVLRRPPQDGPGPAPRLCDACGARGSRARPLQQCSGCHGPERWCSVECQRSSWAAHKVVCRERKAAVAAPAGSQGAV